MKHFGIITFILVILLCTTAFGSKVNSIAANNVRTEAGNIIVPVELANDQAMIGLDLPLQFSEGVTLKEVVFEGTRSEDFDFRHALIDNENNTVIIGMIPMVYGEGADLSPGEGPIANLVFTIDDPSISTIELTAIEIEKPNHTLMFIYNDEVTGQMTYLTPDFGTVSFSLNDLNGPNVPMAFELQQNRPNPFNPTTNILFDLPAPSDISLTIFNVLGQQVKNFNEFRSSGSHTIVWDGTDNIGVQVASGVYFYRLEAGANSATKKMMMLK
jgi:hypothetical protein